MSFPRNEKFPSGSQEIWSEEKFPPTCPTLLGESSNSTRISIKRRCDRRSQLFDVMCARLGPQTPGMEGKPRAATTQEVCSGLSTTTVMPDWPPHPPMQLLAGSLTERGPPDSVSRRLDDMLSISFSLYIINYELPRGFMVPKFNIYNGTSDSFDHIKHYRQVMTLDIGNDALPCKVFPANLHG